jgi:hypothetical protein
MDSDRTTKTKEGEIKNIWENGILQKVVELPNAIPPLSKINLPEEEFLGTFLRSGIGNVYHAQTAFHEGF